MIEQLGGQLAGSHGQPSTLPTCEHEFYAPVTDSREQDGIQLPEDRHLLPLEVPCHTFLHLHLLLQEAVRIL